MRTLCKGLVCAVLLLARLPGWGAPGSEASVSNTVLRAGTEKIKQLEEKAHERDALVKQVGRLNVEIEELRTNTVLGRMASTGGRLREMERKAQGYDELVNVLRKKDKIIADLEKKLGDGSAAGTNRLAALYSGMAEMSNTVHNLEEREGGLRNTIEQLLLGNFEYYEVRKGDTIDSISKNPMIYGDVSKAEWLRQANRGRVKDLENLEEGAVLVVPRFSVNKPFAF